LFARVVVQINALRYNRCSLLYGEVMDVITLHALYVIVAMLNIYK